MKVSKYIFRFYPPRVDELVIEASSKEEAIKEAKRIDMTAIFAGVQDSDSELPPTATFGPSTDAERQRAINNGLDKDYII